MEWAKIAIQDRTNNSGDLWQFWQFWQLRESAKSLEKVN
jgi:hypothetical protein